MGPALAGMDAVIHFAAHAYIGESVGNPRKDFRNNVLGGLDLRMRWRLTGALTVCVRSACAIPTPPEPMKTERRARSTFPKLT
jgi:UDP-arabinose 4-epimerase